MFSLVADVGERYVVFLVLVVVLGTAIGAVLPAISGAGNAFLPANRFAMGSALFTTGRQVGAALGIATVTALQARSPGVDGFHHSYWFVAATMTAAALVALPGAHEMDATAILDYFAPLQAWLEKQNGGQACGW